MKKILSLALVFAASPPILAGDAPQFRGPGGLGVSKETNLPANWSETNNIRWKAPLPGRGLSSPVIADGRVFVTACTGPEQKRLHVLCFDLKNGKKLWERQFWATGTTQCHPKTNMAAPTPVTDGERVYALFATADLVCLDRDGNLVWYRSLVGDYPTVGNNVGMASSPVLWDDLLILCMDNAGESFAAGIDKKTGENRWRFQRERIINWFTPIVFNNNGRSEVIFQGPSGLTSHDPATGKKLWGLDSSFSTIPSPTIGDGMVYAPGGKGLYAVRPPASEGKPETVWTERKLAGNYATPTYYKGRIYALTSRGVFTAGDAATGKVFWSERVEGTFSASPVIADGKIYLAAEDGTVYVMDAGQEAKTIAVNRLKLQSGDSLLATPMIADGALFLRTDNYLYCIGKNK